MAGVYSLTAVALFWPLAWEPPFAAGVALKKKKKQQQKTHIHTYILYICNILLSINNVVAKHESKSSYINWDLLIYSTN